jgi:AcrR family transcriptional regulator
MISNKEYNETQMVEKAMYQFWLNGYEASSLADLTRVMNIDEPAFFETFKSKDELLIRTLKHYLDTVFIPELETLRHKKEISLFIESILTPRNKGASGCYILTISNELGEVNPNVLNILNDYILKIKDALTDIVNHRYPHLSDKQREVQVTRFLSLFTSIPLVYAVISPETCLKYTREMLALIENGHL